MHASARVVASGVAILLLASFALIPLPASAAMERPTWSRGDFWVYAFSSGATGTTTNGTLRMDVTGTESVTVNGTSYSAYHVDAVLTIPFGGSLVFTVPADIWFSTDTLAIVKLTAVVNLTLGTVSIDSTISVSGNPPQTIQWPLTAGASWSSSTVVWTSMTNASGTTYLSSSLTTNFDVQADTTITVPAGTFTTTPLKEADASSGSYTVNYWSAQAGNWARVGEYDSGGQGQGGFNLTSYNYQGGSFFTAVVFGLPVWIWLALLIVIFTAIVGFFMVRRRRPPYPAMPPTAPTMPPQEPPTGPQGPPPGPP